MGIPPIRSPLGFKKNFQNPNGLELIVDENILGPGKRVRVDKERKGVGLVLELACLK